MNLTNFKKIKLPDSPGVYFFRGRNRKIFYIGKATSIKERVRSYFGKDLVFTRGPLILKMVDEARRISFVKTDSVLEALILEAKLIKKHQPLYNTELKDDKSFNYVVITKEEYPRVVLARGRDIPEKFKEKERLYVLGPFPQGGVLKSGMRIVRKIFPFRDRCIPKSGKPCFDRQIGLCPGVCDESISKKDYKKRIKEIISFFEGRKNKIIKDWSAEMKLLAKERKFEDASILKNRIFALKHIQDISLIKDTPKASGDQVFRIEAYDVAHMAGKSMVGVMIAVEDGIPKKSDYRKFKITSVSKANDPSALSEILSRRLKHEEWPLPNLIVVDGNIIQRQAAEKVLGKFGFSIPVLSVVKNDRHKPERIEGGGAIAAKYKKEIELANSEAHRFAVSYHKKTRGRQFLA